METQVYRIEFYECEHDGDLDDYLDDLTRSGAVILGSSINYEAEVCYVRYRLRVSEEEFAAAFKETDAYQFVN